MNLDKTFNSILPILGQLAPNIASMIGGPIAGMAVQSIGSALGLLPEQAKDPAQLIAAVNGMTFDQMTALKKADQDFAVKMKDLDLEPERLANADRDSARDMQIRTRDRAPDVIAGAVITGFFCLTGVLSFMTVPIANHDILIALVGVLAAGVNSILQFFFGSSSSSHVKDETIGKLASAP